MSDVGDVLELLHGAASRWRTVRCTAHHWQHTARQQIATERWMRNAPGAVRQYAGDPDAPRPETYEHRERIWIAKPDRSRSESEHHTVVVRGGRWWSWSPDSGYMSNEHAPEVSTTNALLSYAAHLDPACLIPQIEIVSVDLPVVRAVPRAGGQHGPGLPRGADEHVLELDERGLVVRFESFVDGEVFHTSELVDPVWDEELGDDVFTLDVPAGEEVLPPGHFHARLTLEEAAELASFPVYAIGELPEGLWRTMVHRHRGARGGSEQITVVYHRADGRSFLHLVQHAAEGRHPWARPAGSAHVSVVRDETALTLHSEDFDEDELRALAETLVRV